jgi:hypothetical protein
MMNRRECWCGKPLLYRRDLPQRRGGSNFEFLVGTTRFTASIRREDFRSPISEVFINSSKIDSDVDLTMRDAAILISVALQYGIPVEELAKSMGQNPDGQASSPIGAILAILAKEVK